MVALSKQGVTIFRNNTGVAVFPDGSRVAYGLCPGSSDLIGWKPVTITADMVGKRVAVFVAIEVKTPKGRLSPQQRNFLDIVHASGGISGVAKTTEDAQDITKNT
jgi:hypothetical protein